ncbi:hypothetical protein BJ875DRAFT_517718, partial [Amylocarpus encephaloides]
YRVNQVLLNLIIRVGIYARGDAATFKFTSLIPHLISSTFYAILKFALETSNYPVYCAMPGPSIPPESTSSSGQESIPVASWNKWDSILRRNYLDHFATKLHRSQLPSNLGRKRPALWDICGGCILFLPEKRHILDYLDPALRGVNEMKFNHPLVVLDVKVKEPEDAMVTFAFMTSSKPSISMEILPLGSHPLRKDENGNQKSSYINTSATYTIPWEALQCYSGKVAPNGYRYRLTEESFGRLTERIYGVGVLESRWVEKNALWETFLFIERV